MTSYLRTSGMQIGSSIMDVGGSAPSYPFRAWVNFNSGGGINGAGNVSSVGHPVTGVYDVNFTTALPSVPCIVSAGGRGSVGSDDGIQGGPRVYDSTTTWVRLGFINQGGSAFTNCYWGFCGAIC